jgi:hypothetical protein
MASALSLRQQLDGLISRLQAEVPALKTVVGLEDLDDAMNLADLLPAAVVIYSGDFPKEVSGITQFSGQKLFRYWSVIVVLELSDGPGEALDVLEAVCDAGIGWKQERGGVRYLALAGMKFISRFNQTRVVYEVRFQSMTTL